MRALFRFAFLLLVAAPPPLYAEVVTLPAVLDNTLFEDADGDTSNGAGPAFYAGRNNQGRVRRALLAFDLAGALPADAQVDAVTLALQVSSAADPVALPFMLHRLLRDWGEGTSSSAGGTGAPATTGDATWLHAFYPGTAWSAAGGDFAATASATQAVGDVGAYTWSGPGLVADVVAWLADPATNHGWILRGGEVGTRTVRRFDSRETDASGVRPALTIQFTRLDPVAVTPSSWGRLKSAYRRGAP